jgi:branched-chain amino acid transport system substrate-binding protein
MAVGTLGVSALTPARAADAPPPFKVGIVFSFSLAQSDAPTLFNSGIAAFVKEHGDTVAGRKIVLVRRDDGGIGPDTARRVAQELVVGENVDMLAGLLYTPNAIAAAGVSTAAKKPLLIVNAATSNILAKHPYAFRVGMTTAQTAVPLAQYAAKNGKTAFAIFQDYGPGIEAGTQFEKYFSDGGGKVVGEARVPVAAADFSAYLQRARDAKPDILFVFLNGDAATAPFLRAYHEGGFEAAGVKLYATGNLADDAAFRLTGQNAVGIVSANNYYLHLDSPLNRQFAADFKATSAGVDPNFVAVAAYDMMSAIYQAVGALGADTTADKLVAYFSHLKFESPRGPVEVDPLTHGAVQNIYILRAERRGNGVQNVPIATVPMFHDPEEK